MKKIFTLFCVSAIAVSVLADGSAELKPASFEDITVGADGLYRSDKPKKGGYQSWQSGDFTFATYVDSTKYGTYYYDVAVSALTANNFVADYSVGYDMKSAPGGAAEGDNFAVWYNNYYGNAWVKVASRQIVSGMYVTNNTYAVSSMENGDSYAKKFAQDDWFKLTITGYQLSEKDTTKVGTVEFYLADFRKEGKHYIVKDWTWCDLTDLGSVDAIGFELTSSDTGAWGMNTPAYFCFDELGADTSTSIQRVQTERKPARKAIVNGKLIIGESGYNLWGQKAF